MIHHTFKTRNGFTLIELLVSIAIFVMFLGVVSLSYIGIVRSQRQANEVRKMYSDVRSFVESLAEDMRLGTIDYDCYQPSLSASNNSLLAFLGGIVAHAAPNPLPIPLQLNPNLNLAVPLLQLQNNPCPFNAILDPSTYHADQSPYLAIVNKDQTQKVVYWFDKDNQQLKVKRYVGQKEDNTDIPQWSDAPGYSSTDDGVDPLNGSRTLLSDMVKVTNLTFSVNPPVNPYASANYAKNQYQFQPKVTLTMTVENASYNVAPFHLNFQTTLSSRVYSRSSS